MALNSFKEVAEWELNLAIRLCMNLSEYGLHRSDRQRLRSIADDLTAIRAKIDDGEERTGEAFQQPTAVAPSNDT